jgi:hypothetical protein
VVSFSGDAMTVLFDAQTIEHGGACVREVNAALKDAALSAVRCAYEMLKNVENFSLERYFQYGLQECTITLHAGMGVGELRGLHVHGHPPEIKGPKVGEVTTHRDYPRDGFALMGEPFNQLKQVPGSAFAPT